MEALRSTASQIEDSNTSKDEVLSLVRRFCESSTNMMKQCQESLLGAPAAVAKIETIQSSRLLTNSINKKMFLLNKQKPLKIKTMRSVNK